MQQEQKVAEVKDTLLDDLDGVVVRVGFGDPHVQDCHDKQLDPVGDQCDLFDLPGFFYVFKGDLRKADLIKLTIEKLPQQLEHEIESEDRA